MRTTTKLMKEVEEVTILCDLCGKGDKMPRYAQNRTCHVCKREVCANCQGPYSEEEPNLDIETICVICREMEPEYLPEINETYKTRENLLAQWKENSLARTPKLKSGAGTEGL